MLKKKNLTTPKNFHNDIFAVKNLVYDKCGFKISDLYVERESHEYGACNYLLNGKKVKFRVSKITPAKAGQFVAIWKRNIEGKTQPLDISDDLDFLIITARDKDHFGQFIFPKSVLIEKGVLTKNGKEGKRGIRVYPPWDFVNSKQAKKTQSWQIKYFLTIKNDESTDFDLAKELFTNADKKDSQKIIICNQDKKYQVNLY